MDTASRAAACSDAQLDESTLHIMDAHKVVGLLRSRLVSPRQLIDIVERRIAETEAQVHATPITCFDRARAVAAKLAHLADPPAGYLYGLPVLIKDTVAVEGLRFTEGSTIHASRIAEESEAVVRRIEAMGGIVVGKTNVPEFAAGSHSFNSLFPTTLSPWDVRTAAGGSSGGAAAALASCQCWLATGSDLGGSLRTPAAFCGVVGFRPSLGRVPREGASGPRLGLHGTDGPMGRCVRDVGLLLDAMAETCPSWEFPLPQPDADFKGFEHTAERGAEKARLGATGICESERTRVAWSSLGCSPTPMVNELCRSAAMTLAGGPGCLEELDSNALDFAAAERAFMVLRGERFASTFRDMMSDPALRAQLKPEIVWNAGVGNVPEAAAMAETARKDLVKFASQVDRLFDDVDIICAPATLDAAFDASVRYPTEQAGVRFNNYLEWMRPACMGTMMLCPALVMPCGFLADGRPVGVQLLAAPGKDGRLLEAAAFLEASLGLPRACPEPRRGTQPLDTVGPRTAEEAARHHDDEERRFVERYSA